MSDFSREALDQQFESRRHTSFDISGTLYAPGDKPIHLEIDAKPRKLNVDHRVLVCIHGSHSSAFEYADVAEALGTSDESVARISTSRHHDFDPMSNQPFASEDGNDYRTTGFRGKTYEMEVEDVRKAIRELVQRSEEWFGVPASRLRFDLLGTSLGAVIAAELSAEFGSQIDRLVLASPPSHVEKSSVTLLDTFPSRETFLEPLASFPGKVTVMRGGMDSLVSNEDAQAFVHASSHARFVELPDAGHTFGLFDFEQPQEQRERTRQTFLNLLRTQLDS
ncbi:MAG: hypothetical protein WC654_00405 [Patescibacteria group bacterium]